MVAICSGNYYDSGYFMMKRAFFALFLIIICTVGGNAQTFVDLNEGQKHGIIETPPGGKGEMTFESETHDFDTLEFGGNGTYDFKFKNTGTEPVIITDAKASCGCTVPTYPKDVPVKPGETQIIKVTYNTKRSGMFTKTVTINSNSKDPIKILTIKGYVRAKVTEPTFPTNGVKTDGFVPFEKH